MGSPDGAACRIPLSSGDELHGDLVVPRRPVALVVFAHGSGSSRLSPRNQAVARYLNDRGLATMLMDLLTPDEERRDRASGEHRFDIDLLGRRVRETVDWLEHHDDVATLPIGCFGASTGAAAALVAAAGRPDRVAAVVSRGGRPDLAGSFLAQVRAPTLLIVGGSDTQVLELNKQAARQLSVPVELHVVPGATHLFPEPGAMEQVERVSADWFLRVLSPS